MSRGLSTGSKNLILSLDLLDLADKPLPISLKF
ncbi:MAG: palindromic element RPE4 domain-containing protein [Legionellales bacterium]